MKNVTVYTTSSCGYCRQVKAFLNDNNIKFTEVNAEVDQAAALAVMDRAGRRAVPITDIDGELTVGFDKARLASLLGIFAR